MPAIQKNLQKWGIESKIQSDVELMWLKRRFSSSGNESDVVLM